MHPALHEMRYTLGHKPRSGSRLQRFQLSHEGCVGDVDPALRLTPVVLGSGSYGSVYQVCNRLAGDCARWVAKVVPLYKRAGEWQQSEAQFRREARMAKRLATLGVGPAVLGYKVCRRHGRSRSANAENKLSGKIGLLVTERMDVTVRDWALAHPAQWKRFSADITARVQRLLGVLASHGLRFTDAHTENFMFKLDPATGRTQQLVIVDAGDVRPVRSRDPATLAKYIDEAMLQWVASVATSITPQIDDAR